jgi:hypothetical protein
LPRATGPSDSFAALPRAKRRASSAASTRPLQHMGSAHDQENRIALSGSDGPLPSVQGESHIWRTGPWRVVDG